MKIRMIEENEDKRLKLQNIWNELTTSAPDKDKSIIWQKACRGAVKKKVN